MDLAEIGPRYFPDETKLNCNLVFTVFAETCQYRTLTTRRGTVQRNERAEITGSVRARLRAHARRSVRRLRPRSERVACLFFRRVGRVGPHALGRRRGRVSRSTPLVGARQRVCGAASGRGSRAARAAASQPRVVGALARPTG